jgi:hypothetical protein
MCKRLIVTVMVIGFLVVGSFGTVWADTEWNKNSAQLYEAKNYIAFEKSFLTGGSDVVNIGYYDPALKNIRITNIPRNKAMAKVAYLLLNDPDIQKVVKHIGGNVDIGYKQYTSDYVVYNKDYFSIKVTPENAFGDIRQRIMAEFTDIKFGNDGAASNDRRESLTPDQLIRLNRIGITMSGISLGTATVSVYISTATDEKKMQYKEHKDALSTKMGGLQSHLSKAPTAEKLNDWLTKFEELSGEVEAKLDVVLAIFK